MREEIIPIVRVVVEKSPEILAAYRDEVFIKVVSRIDACTASLNRRPRDFVNYVQSVIREILNAAPELQAEVFAPLITTAANGVKTHHAACCACSDCTDARYMV